MRFRPMRRHAPPPRDDEEETAAAPDPPQDGSNVGPERLLAVEWAQKHQINAVMAERAAMYAGKRNDPVTEEEFLEMIRRVDV